MKKMFLGLNSILLIVSSVMGMRERSKSVPPPYTGSADLLKESSQRTRSHSLPAVILPTMNVGKLTIKELRTPRWLSEKDEYVDTEEIKGILLDISSYFRQGKFEDVYNAVSRLSSDLLVDSQNRPEKWEDVCNICVIAYIMLLESGYVNWNVFQFPSVKWLEQSDLRKHLLIDGKEVTEELINMAGLYSSALRRKLLPQYCATSIPSKPLSDFMSINGDWPTKNYLSWIILRAQYAS